VVSESKHLENENNIISLQANKRNPILAAKEIRFIHGKSRRTVDMDVNVVRAAGRPDIIPNNEISHIVNT
jgi:hypothetical protein